MTAHSIRTSFIAFCFGLLVQPGAFMVSAQPGGAPPDQPRPAAVGAELGHRWYQAKADEWRAQARVLRTLQVVLVVAAIVSSVLAASRIVVPRWWPQSVLPVTAALAIALFTGLDINTQANKQREAWRHLSAALAGYRDGEARIDAVRKAYIEAEAMIGSYNPQAAK